MRHVFSLMSAIVTAFFIMSSMAVADERYTPIQDKTVSKECGACHMAFQPQMLPKRSWKKIMDGLSDHFGEDASLDAKTSQHIKSYMVANAADGNWLGGKFMRGVGDNMTPLRITETPHWVRAHGREVPSRAWKNSKVKTKANCVACHRAANRGSYDDD